MIVSYDATLVVLSISVAIIGSFTGLLIMSRVSGLTGASYKLKIVAGAVAIGSSIWSMHFIGMLALGAQMPLRYDGLITIISVFIAILLTGLGLYAASSGYIERGAVAIGGVLMGSGIAGMHYMGMSALRATCIASYEPFGVAGSIIAGIAASTLALWFVFRERGPIETAAGAVVLGLAIAAMHYTAMLATTLVRLEDVALIAEGPLLSQQGVALIVAIATFLICGLFLIMALPDKKSASYDAAAELEAAPERRDFSNTAPIDGGQSARIPVRRNNSTFFAAPDAILAVRADGHYSWIALRSRKGGIDEHFCERSISTLAKLLAGPRFVRTHRSHLVNIEHVLGYRRHGDGGLLLLDEEGDVSVPVSRSHVHHIVEQLERRIAAPATALSDAAPA